MSLPPGLHVVDRPGEEPGAARVVIVHGAMDRATSFGRVDRKIRDLHVVRYDRRGYGRSQATGAGGIERHVEDLLSVLDDQQATIFGHSIGGVVALATAAARPELVVSVLAFEPPMPWATWWTSRSPRIDDPAEAAEAFMRAAVGDRIWDRLPARTRSDRRAEGEALWTDTASLVAGAPFDPRSVPQPVLVAVGSATSSRHLRAGEELVTSLPRGQLVVVEGAQHGAHLTHAPAVAALVRQAVGLGAGQ
ncbi:MAG: alpha/beta fold hydrolase [Acidimicrobiales bacterium]